MSTVGADTVGGGACCSVRQAGHLLPARSSLPLLLPALLALPFGAAAKKKKAGAAANGAANGGGGAAAAAAPTQQTVPPTVPVKQLFPGGVFPEGEWQSYKEE